MTNRFNNEVASDLGLSVERIGSALRPFVNGDTVSYWLAPDGQNYEVNVQLPRSGRQKLTDLGDLYVSSTRVNGEGTPIMVPLRQVVQFVPATSLQVIDGGELQAPMGRAVVGGIITSMLLTLVVPVPYT